MADEKQVMVLQKAFYKDSFVQVVFIAISIVIAIIFLGAVSIYLFMAKPKPVVFAVGENFRVQPLVPVDQAYRSIPEVFQWVSDVMQNVFVYDFKNYNAQLKQAAVYFTADGWKTFLNQLNIYANYNNVQANKMFVNGAPAAAPTLINQGVLAGRYTWIIQLPVVLSYAGYKPLPRKTLSFEIRVVRVSTEDNLFGVAIDNIILAKRTNTGAGSQ